jgi:hypothetical protein
MNTANKFKSKGAAILKDSEPRPNSVGEFLNDITDGTASDSDLRKPPTTLLHNSFDQQLCPATHRHQLTVTGKESARLHIEIRRDLAEKLLDLVYQRKRDPTIRGKAATQRKIIEEALENYFEHLELR